MKIHAKIEGPWRFWLVRDEDETGVSGTGKIASGVMFGDGSCALRWNTAMKSTAVYASHDDLMGIHGHGGKTRCVWVDREPTKAYMRGVEACMLDGMENAPFSSVGGLEQRHELRAPDYIRLIDAEDYLAGYEANAEASYGADWRTCSFGWAPAMTID